LSSQGTSSGRRTGIVALIVAAALCLLTLTAAPAFAATGSIEGTVTDASTHAAVAGVEVCAWGANEEEGEFGCGTTEVDGGYSIEGLLPGTYEVEFWGPEAYRSKSVPSVIVADGEATSLDVELEPRARIEGSVLDEGGAPVESVAVCAYPTSEEGYEECGYTDASGSYSFAVLEGDYKVEFWSTESNLAVQFYNHQDRWDSANVVHVTEGEDVDGVDANLVAGASISGTVTSAATGQPLEEIEVCSVESLTGQLWICSWTNEKGAYRVGHHSAGTYKVVFSPEISEFFGGESGQEDDGYPTQFWNGQATLAAATPISLSTGQTVTGVDAKLGPPAAVVPPLQVAPDLAPHLKPKRCGRGLQRRRIKGKVRCVRAAPCQASP
jgi:protocatechuate 3,4-dioxygenase beta subunit